LRFDTAESPQDPDPLALPSALTHASRYHALKSVDFELAPAVRLAWPGGESVAIYRKKKAAQTKPNIPASAPPANSHSGFHDLRSTTATVSKVIR
jgi:hypothetical protein